MVSVCCNRPKYKIETCRCCAACSPNTCFPCLAMLFPRIQWRKPIVMALLPSIKKKDLVYHEFGEEKHENIRLSEVGHLLPRDTCFRRLLYCQMYGVSKKVVFS